MTKKEIAKHSLVATITILVTLAAAALSLFLLFKLAPLTLSFLSKALTGYSPSGMAAAGILFFGPALLSGIAAAPLVAGWYTHRALAYLCWGEADFYWSKTPMARQYKEEAKQSAERIQAKLYYRAFIAVHHEMEAAKKEEAQQAKDPEGLKERNQQQFTPCFEQLKKLLAPGTDKIASPTEFINAAKNCTAARKKCKLNRKQFALSRP